MRAWYERPARERGSSECAACRRSNRRGLRRLHRCDGWTVGAACAVACDCACQREAVRRVLAGGGFPPMSLGGPPSLG
jgi:hypothetical protein